MVIQQLKFLILLKMKTKLISIIFLIKYSTDLFIKLFNKKNIFIFPFYHTGGAEKVHLDIVQSFPKKDNLVIFTNTSYNNHFLSEFEKNAKIFHYHKLKHNLYFRKVVLKLLSFIRNNSRKTIFGCNTTYFYDILDYIPSKVKKIDLLHAFSLPDLGGAELYSLKKIPFIDKRIVINQKTKNDFINLYKEKGISDEYLERIKIINIAVDTPEAKPIKNYNKEKLEIIFCGRIAKEKRVHLVVEIAKKVSEIANVKIYGHKEMNIEGIDEFYQKNIINPNELKQIYEISDVLLITSYREGFPVVIKEAMANGVVCISTDVGSISEHVLNNKTGFIVENDSEEEIVNKFVKLITQLFSDKALLKQLSDNAYHHAIVNYNMNKFQQEIRRVIHN